MGTKSTWVAGKSTKEGECCEIMHEMKGLKTKKIAKDILT